jgi:hypothetical protein
LKTPKIFVLHQLGAGRNFDQSIINGSSYLTMLTCLRRSRSALTKVTTSRSRTRPSRTRISNETICRSFSSKQSASTVESINLQHLLALAGVGLGVSAVVYRYQSKESFASAETEEVPAVAKSNPVITNLNKDSAYVVGSSVLNGNLDDEPMLVPHQVRKNLLLFQILQMIIF